MENKNFDINKIKSIELASRMQLGQIEELKTERLLDLIGFPEALITDESKFSDFCIDDKGADILSDKLRIEIKPDDYLVSVLKKM